MASGVDISFFDEKFQSHDIFVDREEQCAVFESAVRSVVDASTDPELLRRLRRTPRANVLVFHGTGGMGKTKLSQLLESRLLAEDFPISGRRVACRIDLGADAATDPESILMRLRAHFVDLGPHWRAFDLALEHYWARKHPGEPLAAFINRNSFLGRAARRLGLKDQITQTIDGALKAHGLVGLAVKTGEAIFEVVQRELLERRLTRGCLYWSGVVEKPPDESRYLMPVLLSWDLLQLQQRKPICAVVFFDTWEAIQEHQRPNSHVNLEDSICTLAYLMPNVLFVMTGRDPLSWHKAARTDLRFRGPGAWPHLSADAREEPRQHALPGLPGPARTEYLRRRLTDGERPAIPKQLRDEIALKSQGMPLFLEVATRWFNDLAIQGNEPRPADFDVPLGELLRIFLQDLPDDQRNVLRAASLAGGFDARLLAAAVPFVRDATIFSFLKKSFVYRNADQPLPYHLQEVVRDAVLTTDEQLDDAWSPNEWQEAGNRILDYLDNFVEKDLLDPASTDHSRLTQGFLRAAEISGRIRTTAPDWVFPAMNTLKILHRWDVLERCSELIGQANSPAKAVAEAARGLVEGVTESLAGAEKFYLQALATHGLSPVARESIEYWLADSWLTQGLHSKARVVLYRLADSTGPLVGDAQKDLARCDYFQGKFRSAQQWVEACLTAESLPLRRAQALGLEGWIKLSNGNFMEAERSFQTLVKDDVLERAKVSRGTSSRNLAFAVSWIRPSEGMQLATRALQINIGLGDQIGVAQCHAALALASAGASDDQVRSHADECLLILRRMGDEAEAWFAHIPVILHWCTRGALDAARREQQILDETLGRYGIFTCWQFVTRAWLAELATEAAATDASEIEWLDGAAAVNSRWVELLRRRTAT